MQLSPTTTASVPAPQLGRWVALPDLTGTRTTARNYAGYEIDPVSGFDEYAAELVKTFDFFHDGAVSANEVRRTQQHVFGSHADGSTDDALFVWPNSTIRQEVVSIEPLFNAAKGADNVLTVAELAAFVKAFDRNGNGYLDTRFHGDRTGAEFSDFTAATSAVVLGARQLTVEGKLEGVGETVDDRWADQLLRV
jgi:hypothetical protein